MMRSESIWLIRFKSDGYSMLELIACLAVFGAILFMSHLPLGTLAGSAPLRKSAHAVSDIISHELMLALETGQNRFLVFDAPSNSIWRAPDEESIQDPSKWRLLLKFPFGISLTSARFGGLHDERNSLELRASGSVTPGVAILSNKNGASCSIVQALRGAQRVVCDE